MFGIGSRLAYLQLIEGTRNRQLAENNRIRLTETNGTGHYFDRKGRILASRPVRYMCGLWLIKSRVACYCTRL